jgi:hypothetical protein
VPGVCAASNTDRNRRLIIITDFFMNFGFTMVKRFTFLYAACHDVVNLYLQNKNAKFN